MLRIMIIVTIKVSAGWAGGSPCCGDAGQVPLLRGVQPLAGTVVHLYICPSNIWYNCTWCATSTNVGKLRALRNCPEAIFTEAKFSDLLSWLSLDTTFHPVFSPYFDEKFTMTKSALSWVLRLSLHKSGQWVQGIFVESFCLNVHNYRELLKKFGKIWSRSFDRDHFPTPNTASELRVPYVERYELSAQVCFTPVPTHAHLDEFMTASRF